MLVPAARYISRDYLQAERERLWPRAWQLAAREEDVPRVGNYLEYRIADQSILIIRSAPDRIAAFHNVCQHRGTRLVSGCGSASELRCRFHGWTWNLDGTNKSVTDLHDFSGLDPATLTLPPVRVGRWGGFIFVNLDAEAGPLEDYLGPVPAMFERFRLDELRIQSHRRTIFPANWKVPIDNFNESYHISGLHPQQLGFIDDTNVVYETAGIHSVELCRNGIASERLEEPLDENEVLEELLDAVRATFHQAEDGQQALAGHRVPEGKTARDVLIEMKRDRLRQAGRSLDGFSDEELIDGFGLHLFPNTVFFLNYGEAFIVRTRPNGDDPDSCIGEIINLGFPEAGEPPRRPTITEIADPYDHDWGQVIGQDLACFREVQIGMHSRGFAGLRLADYQELRIRHMHRNLTNYIGF